LAVSRQTLSKQASKYFDETKVIRSKIESEDNAITAAVSSFDKEIAADQTELKAIQERLADRTLIDEQVATISDAVKEFSQQKFEITTYWNDKECLAISNRIGDALTRGGWKCIPPERASMLLGGIIGVLVYVNPKADENTKNAANKLIGALNESHIDAEMRLDNDPALNNKIHLDIGSKR
jgi:hypothetical protein